MKLKSSLLCFVFSGFSILVFSQPNLELYPIGCHNYTVAALGVSEPTEAELVLMENSNRRSDSFDILNYAIHLDVSDYNGKSIKGFTNVEFKTKLDQLKWIVLDLKELSVDSIYFRGSNINYSYTDNIIVAYFGESLNQNIVASIDVYYHGNPTRDPVWGGFYFADNYTYNLGIGLSSTPPNFGKVWFPCFDNFVERTMYDYYITSKLPARAYCVGTFIKETQIDSFKVERHYNMLDQIPTYLSNIAVADYSVSKSNHQGLTKNIPIELISKSGDQAKMVTQFDKLPKAIDAFEFWFGPYRFERVGFTATTVGAMEHPTNVAYPISTVLQGDLGQNENLYAHEFGHHWWGDLTTLDDARDMWIKEGTAEYSMHLFHEYVYGRDKFLQVVKSNLSDILAKAHISDSSYLALSPMPYSKTYGTHTYRKGAAMIHNIRGYLGDSLYRKTCHMVFDSLTGKSMNAYEFRDFLTRRSGIDMTNYFEDYIFNPGYCTFYIDTFEIATSNGQHFVSLNIKQKKHHANHLYTDVPIEISMYDKDFNRILYKQKLSGSTTNVTLLIPDHYKPEVILLNEDQRLNLASLQSNSYVTKTGNIDFSYASMTPAVPEITDTLWVNMVHHLVGPSEGMLANNITKLSTNHFWQVSAISKGTYKMTGRVEYNGADKNSLDNDVVFVSEDSVLLVYRKDWTESWHEYPFYTKIVLGKTDRKGFLRIDQLLPGEYAIANGYHVPNAVHDDLQVKINVYPNPAVHTVTVSGLQESEINEIVLYDINGKCVQDHRISAGCSEESIEVCDLHQGFYELVVYNQKGHKQGSTFLEIAH